MLHPAPMGSFLDFTSFNESPFITCNLTVGMGSTGQPFVVVYVPNGIKNPANNSRRPPIEITDSTFFT